MEFLESDDAKGVLLKKSAMHKKVLEDEVRMLSENTEKVMTNALVIVGTLAVTYFLVRKLTKKPKAAKRAKVKKIKLVNDSEVAAPTSEMKSTDPGIMSQIGSALAAQATVFLLDLAKDKLSAFLASRLEKEAETANERS